MSETSGKIKYLIADTTAFINAVPLNVNTVLKNFHMWNNTSNLF